MVGTPHVRSGWMTIGRARLGERVFVGNSAVLPAEVRLGNNVLIGALSIAPLGEPEPVADGTSWFGSPPISLPVRKKPDAFSENETYHPSQRLVALRLAIEFLRIILPSTLFVILASLIINATDIMQDHVELGIWLLTVPALYAIAGLLSILATLLLKVLVIGRYREDQKPLWSGFVWRTELLTGVYDNFCVLFFLNLLRGTPFIVWVLRAFGMKIGRQCYVDTTWFTEFDLVEIGDEAALNEDANIQTHLFEDRILKMGRVSISRRCAVGAMTTVLYGTTIEDDASLGELSLLMKGEKLPAGTRWHGIPARAIPDAGQIKNNISPTQEKSGGFRA
jgi:non-ribosomal peptide synthetase-like protein